jgi:LmbE family N-acetylglucosaminyl deacetylase
VEAVIAESVLVLAPHYDDEVLGCGGLIGDLTARGTPVRVLFATDGSGGVETVEDPAAYAAQRQEEAEAAAAVLGLSGVEHLGLPDGALRSAGDALREAIAVALREHRPDLLLLPGPLEVTADHRAVFDAVFALAHASRPGDELREILDRVTFLLYEVNHPAYPDLLVDVSERLSLLERAMDCYPSQQELHDYLGAAVGLRRYRALSLPSDVTAAEGYRRLSIDDFATRSRSRLVAWLGGPAGGSDVTDGPLVSVVVRTRNRPHRLAEALASLARSRYRRLEVILVNDGGERPAVPDDFPFPWERLDLEPGRGRAAAANAGVEAARGDLVGFLDDDDLVYPEHFENLVGALGGADVRVAYSDAAVVRYALGAGAWEESERRLPYSRDFSADLLLVDNYIPFNTLLVERDLFAEVGPFETGLPIFEDWDFLIRLSRLVPLHHLARVTCEYRHFEGGDQVLGERPRERADFLEWKSRVLERHRELVTPERLARIVDLLRTEAVTAVEAERSWRRDRDSARRELGEAVDRGHRLHGEVAGLRAQAGALAAEIEALRREVENRDGELRRLYTQESELREVVRSQDEHLARTYGEIRRLEELLQAMRSTRAWRLHEWLERRRR